MAFNGSPVTVAGFGSNTFSTASINTTGADLLIVQWSGSGVPTLTDSKGNTWLSAVTDTAFRICTIYYAWNPIVGTGHTFTLTGTAFDGSAAVFAFTGGQTASDPKDQTNHNNGFGVSTLQAGSVTPATNDQLVFAAVQIDTGGATIGSGFSTPVGSPGSGGSYLGGAGAFLIQTTAAAANPTWSFSNANASAAIATFKAAAGGGGGGFVRAWARGANGLIQRGRTA